MREYIGGTYGMEYVASREISSARDGRGVQDAHEAIRPTDVTRTPAAMKDSLTRDQFRLYQLVWKRFVASRMQPAKYETTSVRIAAGEYRFTVAASRIAFEGFRCVYTEADEEKEENNVLVKGLMRMQNFPKKALRRNSTLHSRRLTIQRPRWLRP